MRIQTSHKIAITLLLLLLIVPILLIFGYQNEMRHNRFRLKDPREQGFISTNIPPVKYVSVNGTGIECNIIRADSSYCTWPDSQLPGEWISATVKEDTLFITNRQSPTLTSGNAYRNQQVNIFLPVLTQLTAIAAQVSLDTISTNLTILAKNSQLNINRYDMSDLQSRWSYDNNRPRSEVDTRTFTANGVTTQLYNTIDHLSVQADNSIVYIGNTNHIRNLDVQAEKSSVIEIREGAVIDQFHHQFDSTVKVKATWPYLEQLVINH